MTRFTYKGIRYSIEMICSYGPALSRSNIGATDYRIIGKDWISRFSTEYPIPRGTIERVALAAYKRDRHNMFRAWAKKNGFATVGAAMNFSRS